MILSPIVTYDSGGFSVYGGTTHHGVLAHALDPDGDGVSRSEPSAGELVLGYGSLGVSSGVRIYLRGVYVGGEGLNVRVRFYDGGTLLWSGVVELDSVLRTHGVLALYQSQVISDARVGVSTTDVLPSAEEPAPNVLQLTMLVIESDVGGGAPPLRVVRMSPAYGYVMPMWLMEITTNVSGDVDVPAGFVYVGSPDGVRYSDGVLKLPEVYEESRFIVHLRER